MNRQQRFRMVLVCNGSGLPSDNDNLVHYAHLLHGGRHCAVDGLVERDNLGILGGREGLRLRIVAVHGNTEMIASRAGSARSIWGVNGDGDFGLAYDVTLGADRGLAESPLSCGECSGNGRRCASSGDKRSSSSSNAKCCATRHYGGCM